MHMLEIGSAVLAVVNIGVMWGMAHRWRYAWHGNLGLQLLWLPYDTITKQYGLFALGAVMTVVSIKGCLHRGEAQSATAGRGRPRHRRPRRGWFGRRTEGTDAVGQAKPLAPSLTPALSSEVGEVAAVSTQGGVRHSSTTSSAMLAQRGDRRRQLHAGLAHRRKQAVHPDRRLSHPKLNDVPDEHSRPVVSQYSD
jgi:hypothetical protein